MKEEEGKSAYFVPGITYINFSRSSGLNLLTTLRVFPVEFTDALKSKPAYPSSCRW